MTTFVRAVLERRATWRATYAAIIDVLRAPLRRVLPPPLRAHRARPHCHRLSGGLFRAVDWGQFVTSLGGAGATVACAKGLHRTAPVPVHARLNDLPAPVLRASVVDTTGILS